MTADGRELTSRSGSYRSTSASHTQRELFEFGPRRYQVLYIQLAKSGSSATSLRRRDELGFRHHYSRTTVMPNNLDCKVATADALTLLLHNQHALSAAIEEITKWLSENGIGSVAANAVSAMETLDTNAQAIADSILRIRQS